MGCQIWEYVIYGSRCGAKIKVMTWQELWRFGNESFPWEKTLLNLKDCLEQSMIARTNEAQRQAQTRREGDRKGGAKTNTKASVKEARRWRMRWPRRKRQWWSTTKWRTVVEHNKTSPNQVIKPNMAYFLFIFPLSSSQNRCILPILHDPIDFTTDSINFTWKKSLLPS